VKPMWAEPGIEIYCGDCRSVLPAIDLRAVRLPIIDPPYGIRHSSNHGASWEGQEIAGDDLAELRDWLIGFLAPRPMYVFGSWKVPKPLRTRGVLIWDKGPAFGMCDLSFPWKPSFEEIYVIGDGFAGRRDEGVLRGHMVVSWESKGRVHQHQKPESLIAYLIGKVPGADFVLDPCMGSGTTLRVAKDLGIRAIGIDVSADCCETAIDRLRQGALFGAA
jgi:DNA modification methylase